MKLYDSGRAPNPRRVRIFLAEKGVSIPLVAVDLAGLEHRRAEYAAVNPVRQTPALELDDGTVITESVAICRYVEETHPDPPLFGTGALGRARVEMWQRRLEFELLLKVAAVFRHLHPGMATLQVPQIAPWGEMNKPLALAFLDILDAHLAHHAFVAGTFSVADITGLVAIDLMKPARLIVPDHLEHVRRWHRDLAGRPSAGA